MNKTIHSLEGLIGGGKNCFGIKNERIGTPEKKWKNTCWEERKEAQKEHIGERSRKGYAEIRIHVERKGKERKDCVKGNWNLEDVQKDAKGCEKERICKKEDVKRMWKGCKKERICKKEERICKGT